MISFELLFVFFASKVIDSDLEHKFLLYLFLIFFLAKGMFNYLAAQNRASWAAKIFYDIYNDLLSLATNRLLSGDQNYSRYTASLHNDLPIFMTNGIMPVLTLLVEAILAILLLIYLIYLSPIITLIIIASVISSFFINKKFLLKKLIKKGNNRKEIEHFRIRKFREYSENIIQLHFSNSINFQKANLMKMHAEYTDIFEYQWLFQPANRIVYESISTFGLIIILILFSSGYSTLALPDVAGIFLAGLRMSGSISRCLIAIQSITYVKPMIQEYLNLSEKEKSIKLSTNRRKYFSPQNTSIHIKDIKLDLGETRQEIDDIVIKKGVLNYIIGRSGIGKSTFVKSLILENKFGIKVYIDDKFLRNLSDYKISYVGQNVAIEAGSIASYLGVDKSNLDAANSYLEKSGLISEGISLDRAVEEEGSNLSGGQLQRLAIVKALLEDSDFLFLDEPFSALDQISAENMSMMLDEFSRGRYVIMISHVITNEDGDKANIVEFTYV